MSKRLTHLDCDGWYIDGPDGTHLHGPEVDRLAAYEDTELEPGDIAEMKTERRIRQKTARPYFDGTGSVEAVQVIRTVTIIGKGLPEDTVRPITQYWSMDGKLLAQYDPQFDNFDFNA